MPRSQHSSSCRPPLAPGPSLWASSSLPALAAPGQPCAAPCQHCNAGLAAPLRAFGRAAMRCVQSSGRGLACPLRLQQPNLMASTEQPSDQPGLLRRRSRAIAFKAIADGLPSNAALQARLVRAPYPVTLMHELQLHAWNDVQADGRQYVVDLMDDAGALYEKVRDGG